MTNLARNAQLALSVARLGYGVGDRILLFLGLIVVWLSAKLTRKTYQIPVTIRVEGKRASIILTSFSDFLVLYEVFVLKEYDVTGDYRTIVDVGANVGFSALYFAYKFPDAAVYAIEPDPITYKALLRNTRGIPTIIARNGALGAQTGVLPFYVYPGSSISSSLVRRLPDQTAIEVPVATLDDLMVEYGIDHIDLLKVDVEGAEVAVLTGLTHPERVNRFIGEIHLDLIEEDATWFTTYFSGRTITRRDISASRYILDATLATGT